MRGLCLHLLSNRLDLMYLGYKYEDQKKIKNSGKQSDTAA